MNTFGSLGGGGGGADYPSNPYASGAQGQPQGEFQNAYQHAQQMGMPPGMNQGGNAPPQNTSMPGNNMQPQQQQGNMGYGSHQQMPSFGGGFEQNQPAGGFHNSGQQAPGGMQPGHPTGMSTGHQQQGSMPGQQLGGLPGGQQPGGMPGQQPGGMPGQQPGGMPGQQPGGMPGQQPGGMPGQQRQMSFGGGGGQQPQQPQSGQPIQDSTRVVQITDNLLQQLPIRQMRPEDSLTMGAGAPPGVAPFHNLTPGGPLNPFTGGAGGATTGNVAATPAAGTGNTGNMQQQTMQRPQGHGSTSAAAAPQFGQIGGAFNAGGSFQTPGHPGQQAAKGGRTNPLMPPTGNTNNSMAFNTGGAGAAAGPSLGPMTGPPQGGGMPSTNASRGGPYGGGPAGAQAQRAPAFGSVTGYQPAGSSSRPIQRIGGAGNAPNFLPISALSPYAARWIIKARVTSKVVRTFNNKNGGEGQLMNLELVDRGRDTIRCVMFSELVAKFGDLVQEHKVYTFQGGQVKNANKRYNPNAEYEIQFNNQTQITAVPEDDDEIIPYGPSVDFTPIANIETSEKGSQVNVFGVLIETGDVQERSTKNGPKNIREFQVADDSGPSGGAIISVTAWGEKADHLPLQVGDLVILVNAKVDEFQGKKLTLNGLGHTKMVDQSRQDQLLEFWTQNGENRFQWKKLSGQSGGGPSGSFPPKTLKEVELEAQALLDPTPNLDGSEKKDKMWFDVKNIRILQFKSENAQDRDPFYIACTHKVMRADWKTGNPTAKDCNKKAEQQADSDDFACADGHVTSLSNPSGQPQPCARYIAKPQLYDTSGSLTVTTFDEAGQKLFGVPANDVWYWTRTDTEYCNAMVEDFNCGGRTNFLMEQTFNVKLMASKDSYQDTERVKFEVKNAEPVGGHAALTEIMKRSAKEDMQKGLMIESLAAHGFHQAQAASQGGGAAPGGVYMMASPGAGLGGQQHTINGVVPGGGQMMPPGAEMMQPGGNHGPVA
ncbi:unnamed protein product [Amoebophrya sp. A25]|nr:unnamed protein product [Amoebophrya sp. A25]|eukprot:GSA25T00011575001.1